MDSKKKADDDGGKPHKTIYVYGLITKKEPKSLSANHTPSINFMPASIFVKDKAIKPIINPGDVVLIESDCPDCVRQIVVMSGGIAMTMFRLNNESMMATSLLPWTCIKNYVFAVDPESIKPRYFIFNDDNGHYTNESDLQHSSYSYHGVYRNITQ